MSFGFAFPNGQLPIWIALGAVLVGLCWAGLRRMDRGRAKRLHAFVEAALAPRLLEGYDARLQRPLRWFALTGLAFLLIAVAQPKWGQGMLALGREGRDVLVLLDTSESMNAANPAPSRLAKARQKIESLIERLPGDRVGLIAFSGGSALSCPLTLDHAHFKNALMNVDTDTVDAEGTNIADGLAMAEQTFDEDAKKGGDESKASRAVVLISDGEQIEGDAVEKARDLSPKASIYVLGIGDPNGALVNYPQYNLQHGSVPNDFSPHLSKLDEEALTKIATEGQGTYVRATPDDSDVDHLAEGLQSLSSHAVEGELRFNLVDRYQWPLAISILCFALEGLWLVLMPWLRVWWARRREARKETAYV